MQDWKMFFQCAGAVAIFIFAWCMNHFLIEKKRQQEKKKELSEQTGLMLQVVKDCEILTKLIDQELAQNEDCGENKSRQALEYVEEICDKVPYQILVDVKQEICKNQKIHMEYKKEVEKESYLDGMDMVIVLGNLLDNAIEHCKDQKKQSVIRVSICQKMNQVQIIVENTREGKAKSGAIAQYSTTKQNHLLHGYGLLNVQEIVKKHHGSMEIIDKDHWFVVKIQMECGEQMG